MKSLYGFFNNCKFPINHDVIHHYQRDVQVECEICLIGDL